MAFWQIIPIRGLRFQGFDFGSCVGGLDLYFWVSVVSHRVEGWEKERELYGSRFGSRETFLVL